MPLHNPAIIKTETSSTATPVTITADTESKILLDANPDRIGAIFFNNSTSDLYIDLDNAVTTTSFALKIAEGGYLELPFKYTGAISGIWESTDGDVQIRELI